MEPNEQQHLCIGLNRKFFSDITVEPFNETADADYNFLNKNNPESEQVQKENTVVFETLMIKNLTNIKQYKEGGGRLLFHDDELIPKHSNIDYNNLMTILSYDETSNEAFISKDKGTWSLKNDIKTETMVELNTEKDKINNENKENVTSNNNNIIDKENTNSLNSGNVKVKAEFESRFESGNLRMAIQISENEYDLLLKNDINAFKYAHWFFFQVKFTIPKECQNKTFKFNIINCEKEESIYNRGLKVLSFSEKSGIWTRVGKNISYYPNGISIETKKYYTLTFTIDVEQSDTIYLCYAYPYTFTYLQKFLSSIEKKSSNNIFRREVLGKTLAGNNLDLLLITNFTSNFDEIALRPAIVLTARVHPSETCASFVIHGIIEFLVSDKPEAQKLRNEYVFKVIPMLNPDGVINGNSRCSLLGKDLNRLWVDPRENSCPTIYFAKEMIRKTLLSRNIFLYCDFHGHSNTNNFFLYGTETEGKEGKSYQEKVLSRLIASKFDAYDHGQSTYKIVKAKRTTARAILKNEFGITYSYCLEASLCGVTIGKDKGKYFNPSLLFNISNAFCMSMIDLTNKTIYNNIINSMIEEETNRILSKNQLNSDKITPFSSSSTNKIIKISKDKDDFTKFGDDKKALSESNLKINKLTTESSNKSDSNIIELGGGNGGKPSKKSISETKKMILESKKKYKK